MSGVWRARDGAKLAVHDAGGPGLPVILQHGLCGDAGQTAEVFPSDPRLRRVTLECRGHGGSEPGDAEAFSLAQFSDDVAAFMEDERIAPAVVGGISMGAAIALRLAVRRPDLVQGLVLARPAWVHEAAPPNMLPNAEVGRLLGERPAREAAEIFRGGALFARLEKEAPDNLASLTGFFARKPQRITAALLQRISADGPGVSESGIAGIAVPTLVIGTARDAIHPLAYAERLAALIPDAAFAEITPKGENRAAYAADFAKALANFLEGFL